MEIEKICRTCLGLSGPLLSIYDGDSNGGLADMLGCFAIRPRQDDNMPHKVCLSCISEINRCYSFKLKCDNSDRTLRQLLPDALPEIKPDLAGSRKLSLIHKSVQTASESTKQVISTGVQTIRERKVRQVHQHVQTQILETQEAATSPPSSIKPIEKGFRSQKQFDHAPVQDADNQRHHNIVSKRDSPHLILKRRRVESFDASEEQNNHEIILELHSDDTDGIGNEGGRYIQQGIPEQPMSMDGNDNEEGSATYYEITKASFDDENETSAYANEATEAEDLGYNDVEEEEYTHLIYAAEQAVGSTQHTNFTIYNNENGETEIIAKRPATRSTTRYKQAAQDKPEFKCPKCIMTFVSEKYLARHLFKRHNLEQKDAEKENVAKQSKNNDTVVLEVIKDEFIAQQIPATENENVSMVEVNAAEGAAARQLPFHCENCNAGFAFRKSLSFHQKQNVCNAISYKCDQCDRVFITEEKLNEHKVTHNFGSACTECNKVFENADELSQHMVDDHKRKIRNQCSVCKKVFTMLSALKEHTRIHNGEKPFPCDICGKAFSQSANLRQHKMRHSKEKKFKCDECPNTYVTKAELFSHKRTHTGDTPYKCEYCGAQFSTSSSLIKHRRKHTGERPYACEICPMRFTALNVLKNHRRTHTGERPFRCSFCYKCFSQKGDCQIHQRTHTGERKHVCECGEKFTHLATLRQHKKLHEKDNATQRTSSRGQRREESMHITILDEDDDALESQIEENDEELVQITLNNAS